MNCLIFFRGWILIRLTWILSRFVPNSVEILTWSLWKKLFRENVSEIFMQTKAILYQNLWNFALLPSVFILRPYCTEKIYASNFICCLHPGKEARPQTNHKKRIRGRKAKTFCFRKTGFVNSQSKTYYALLLGCFGLKFSPDVRHCVYWVLADTWALDSSHKIGNKFCIDHCQGWQEGSPVCETVWFFFVGNTHTFDLKFVAFFPEFSGDSYVEFLEKTTSGVFFRNFHANQGYPLPKLVKFRPNFCSF